MKVIICGDRHWDDRQYIKDVIGELFMIRTSEITIVEGGARGADTIARQEAEALEITVKEFPANWTKYSLAAGPIRNQEMLDFIKPGGEVYAFHNDLDHSKGTLDMVTRARDAHVPVMHFYVDRQGNRCKQAYV